MKLELEIWILHKNFPHKIFEIKKLQNVCYFHKFSVKDPLHEHFCTFEQFCVVSGSVCVALNHFFLIIKRKSLISETPIEIESTVAKQTKKCDFVSFKTFC